MTLKELSNNLRTSSIRWAILRSIDNKEIDRGSVEHLGKEHGSLHVARLTVDGSDVVIVTD